MLDRRRADRVVDVASVVLISVAAVLTAVCGYESGRWRGQQARYYNVADTNRVLSAEAADRAVGINAINTNMFLQYVNAVDAADTRKATFIYRRFGPVMHSAMKAWLATKPMTNPSAPSSPFAMPQYVLPAAKESHRFRALAIENFNKAQLATRHADDFLLLTIVFAGVSFLGGISTKMVFPQHLIIVLLGCVGIAYGLIRLVELPFLGTS